jgi:Cys-rich protein (TIGR01571 family)
MKSEIPVAEGVAVSGAPGAETPLVPTSAGAGQWRTGLCGCFEDCSICLSVCCCHPITTGQIYERTVQKALVKRLPLLSCMSIAVLIWTFDIAQQIISSAHPGAGPFDQLAYTINATVYGAAESAQAAPDAHTAPSPLAMLGELLGFLSFALVFGVVYTVRSAIRRREGIKPSCCAEVPQCEDACCAWCVRPPPRPPRTLKREQDPVPRAGVARRVVGWSPPLLCRHAGAATRARSA